MPKSVGNTGKSISSQNNNPHPQQSLFHPINNRLLTDKKSSQSQASDDGIKRNLEEEGQFAVHHHMEHMKNVEVTTTTEVTTTSLTEVSEVTRKYIAASSCGGVPENTKVNVDETGYDPFDQNLVDASENELDTGILYEGLTTTTTAMPAAIGDVSPMSDCCFGSLLDRRADMRDPELDEVIDYLSDPSDTVKENASAYLQHLLFNDEQVKQKTRILGGIVPLIILLRHDNPVIQRNAAGALRNLCFGEYSEMSKVEVTNAGGIGSFVKLIRLSPFDDIRELVTAALWNMSSSEDLRERILDESLYTLVNAIIVPYSGWSPDISERRNPQGLFPISFKNATGILRNCSFAGYPARQKLRATDNLIPSIIHAVQSVLMCGGPEVNNKPVENCIWLLRNLSYNIEEVTHLKQQPDKVQSVRDVGHSGPNMYGPIQVHLLWQLDLVPAYVTLLRSASNPSVLEASAGCIQNLSICPWPVVASEIRAEVRRAHGLPILSELLRALEFEPVIRCCAMALRNLSLDVKNRLLIGKNAMQDLVRLLPPYISKTEVVARVLSDSTLTTVLITISSLIQKNEPAARACAIAGGVDRVIGMLINCQLFSTRVVRYAKNVLITLWSYRNSRELYKTMGYTQQDFLQPACSSVNHHHHHHHHHQHNNNDDRSSSSPSIGKSSVNQLMCDMVSLDLSSTGVCGIPNSPLISTPNCTLTSRHRGRNIYGTLDSANTYRSLHRCMYDGRAGCQATALYATVSKNNSVDMSRDMRRNQSNSQCDDEDSGIGYSAGHQWSLTEADSWV